MAHEPEEQISQEAAKESPNRYETILKFAKGVCVFVLLQAVLKIQKQFMYLLK